jgi:hypothetical protein
MDNFSLKFKIMTKKTKIIIITAAVIVLAGLTGLYFIKQNRNTIPVNSNPENSVEQKQEKIVTEYYSIDLPVGWKQTESVPEVSAMAFYLDEKVTDPAIQKLNFKSYLTINSDTLGNRSMADYLQEIRNSLTQAVTKAVFAKEQDLTINDNLSHEMEIEIIQEGTDFKLLMVIVKGKEDDVWTIMFDTTKDNWDGYKDMLYTSANSFVVKK